MTKLDNRIDKQIDALVGAITDPIVVFTSPWMDTLPEWIKGEVKMQRLAQLMKGEEEVATDAEALAYMYPRALEAPLDSDWTEIYLYLGTQVMGDRMPDDIRKDSLSDYQMGLLMELKRWIYRQRVKARKERRRAEGRRQRVEAEAKAPKQLGLGL